MPEGQLFDLGPDNPPMTCDLGTIAAGGSATVLLTSPTDEEICEDNTIENGAVGDDLE